MEREEQRRPASVLVVDDELCISYALAQALRAAGFVADVVGNGEEALRVLESTAYDVMILDLSMPGIGGEEVMRVAHARWPELLILVLTGYATLESAITAVKSEVADYLRKPISEHEVVKAVEHALRKRAARRRREQLVQVIYQALEELRGMSSPPTSVPNSLLSEQKHYVYLLPLVLDRQRRQLFLEPSIGNGRVELSENESRILSVLMTRPGRVLSCTELVREALGEDLDTFTAENIVRPIISRLRTKLRSFALADMPVIRTVRGRGYFIELPPRPAEPEHS
ncbi:MAG: response regulator transcription factor [Anaerolineae bacterium]|nr:response regulator transcription factor [Anaerolineae bacterium]MDW8071463.1 response regulator transcription factor [Anaerolineae bacterium]